MCTESLRLCAVRWSDEVDGRFSSSVSPLSPAYSLSLPSLAPPLSRPPLSLSRVRALSVFVSRIFLLSAHILAFMRFLVPHCSVLGIAWDSFVGRQTYWNKHRKRDAYYNNSPNCRLRHLRYNAFAMHFAVSYLLRDRKIFQKKFFKSG